METLKTERLILQKWRESDAADLYEFSKSPNVLMAGAKVHESIDESLNGSHHIFYKDGIEEIINIQPVDSKAKSYQVKQVRQMVLKYKLGGDLDV